MTPRERFALMICLEITLIGGIVALFMMRNHAETRAHEAPRAPFSSAVVTGVPAPFLDFHDAVEVNVRFAARATREGGLHRALVLPGDDAAHLFRLDPLDRGFDSATSPGPDFYLEDPQHRASDDEILDLSPSFASCLGGESGNGRVFVIEGDLWVHSHEALAIRFPAADAAATFVVYGDVHFQDDLLAAESSRIAFVALRDERGRGGNIVLGDPDYATLDRIDAWLYAEGDVVARELRSPVVVNGGIAAGGKIVVDGGSRAGGLAVLGRSGAREAPGLGE